MKSASPELIALLAERRALLADLFTISLSSGTVLRLTSAPDFSVAWNGHTFARDYSPHRGAITSTVGLEVDEVEVTLYPRPDDLINGQPLAVFVHNGGMDGARVLIERAFMRVPGDPIGVLPLFEGSVSQSQPSRTAVLLTVSSDLISLNQRVPKNVIEPTCINTLFDGLCGLDQSTYTHLGTVHAGSTRDKIVTGLAQADGYFTVGGITFLSGANAGVSVSIKRHAAGSVWTSCRLRHTPAVGDEFAAVAGCDRQLATCKGSKFSDNSTRFRAFRLVPAPVASA